MSDYILRCKETPDRDQVSVTTVTAERIFKSCNPSDAYALYGFYAHTARWQGTLIVKCTTEYVKQALDWGDDRFRRAKATLMELGLIQDVIRKDEVTQKVIGWYVQIFYLVRGQLYGTESTLPENLPLESPPAGQTHHKCLMTGIKVLNNNKEVLRQAEEIYQAYPKHVGKPIAIQKIVKQLDKHTFDHLLSQTKAYAESRKGEDAHFTPHPATWFHQERFNDDPSTWGKSEKPKAAPKKV